MKGKEEINRGRGERERGDEQREEEGRQREGERMKRVMGEGEKGDQGKGR